MKIRGRTAPHISITIVGDERPVKRSQTVIFAIGGGEGPWRAVHVVRSVRVKELVCRPPGRISSDHHRIDQALSPGILNGGQHSRGVLGPGFLTAVGP